MTRTFIQILLLLQRSIWTCHIWSPVRAMNRIVRRKSVDVPWSLFPRELYVGHVLSLSSLWRDHECMACIVVCDSSSSQGQMSDSSMPLFFMWIRSLQWLVLNRNIMVWHDFLNVMFAVTNNTFKKRQH